MTNALVGKKLAAIQIASDREALRFICEDGEVIARCYGDCCSRTWVESVETTAMLPAVVLSVDSLALPEFDGDKDPEIRQEWDGGELIRFYGCKITTDRGHVIIDYRNESNGYYGGSLGWPGDLFYGGVYGQNVSNEEWQPLFSLTPEG